MARRVVIGSTNIDPLIIGLSQPTQREVTFRLFADQSFIRHSPKDKVTYIPSIGDNRESRIMQVYAEKFLTGENNEVQDCYGKRIDYDDDKGYLYVWEKFRLMPDGSLYCEGKTFVERDGELTLTEEIQLQPIGTDAYLTRAPEKYLFAPGILDKGDFESRGVEE